MDYIDRGPIVPTTKQEGLEQLVRIFAADPALIGFAQCVFLLALDNNETVAQAWKTALQAIVDKLTRLIEREN